MREERCIPTSLGADGLAVSRLGLGCMSMTGAYGPADPGEATATVLEALDSGVTMFDTGDFYGDGANEELLGRTLAPHRDRTAPHRDRAAPRPRRTATAPRRPPRKKATRPVHRNSRHRDLHGDRSPGRTGGLAAG
ncbi:aldo/keto reductase [Streptomyces guryensis]|uniref:aldo/keto reductase n=1 Tax=Streptomyces guryensis TaxID=2886947 RepID=UPI0027DF2D3B|nr:aldo/keto reductase [Streptomyces guryensis]